MRKLPPLSAVRVFEAAARHENFTKAAAELGMTQAAVSYQIRILEERLGAPLFARSKRRVTLTEAGKRAAPVISGAFDTLADAFSTISADNENVLAISTAPTFASAWLAPRLGAFQVSHPDLAVRLETGNRLVDFISEDVDVAIRIGKGPWAGLRQHFLLRSHFSPICSPEFRDQHRLERPEQLLDLARLSPDDNWWKIWLAEVGVELGEEVHRPGIMLDSQIMEANAVLAGHGVALMTPHFWMKELKSGRMVQPFPHIRLSETCYWLVYPEHKRNQPKIRAFREWLLAEMSAASAEGPVEAFVEPNG